MKETLPLDPMSGDYVIEKGLPLQGGGEGARVEVPLKEISCILKVENVWSILWINFSIGQT